ncbi:PREDICTED: inactive ribonuclease-like protein 9 [Chinchilla lanigera]|uniref:inactive ribonuclease-like protein 9 n=1 Tax=Chinchilla lanigera TaxID=34839 RepID=UPI0006987437|nr:PREDICTED: inactive ribonuclease-like protein 9 [Chinchilla lanigera]
MRILFTKLPAPLLFLLLLPPMQLQGTFSNFYLLPNFTHQEFENYIYELYGTGPTRPPSKRKIEKIVLAEEDWRPLDDPEYCSQGIRLRNVQYKMRCVQYHYFLKTTYEMLQKTCYNTVVPCEDGTDGCKKSKEAIEGVFCQLIEGTDMPNCDYESSYMHGYVLITCRWNNATREFIPHTISNMVPQT